MTRVCVKALQAARRRERKFIRYVYDQLLGYGPRTNGINQEFCVSLGQEALALLKTRPRTKRSRKS